MSFTVSLDGLSEEVRALVRDELASRRGWLSVPSAATYLDTSETALRSLVKRGAVPVHRVNGRLLFSPDELDAWVLAA